MEEKCAQCDEPAGLREQVGSQYLPVCSKTCKDLLQISEDFKVTNLLTSFANNHYGRN